MRLGAAFAFCVAMGAALGGAAGARAAAAAANTRPVLVELFRPSDHKVARFPVRCRIDTQTELEYFRSGGVMPYVLRNLARGEATPMAAE